MASPPVEEWGRSGDLCDSLIGRTNWHAVLVYVFCLSLVFSLNMHPRTCLLWMCALLPFHLISSLLWLWIIRTQKLPLTWGSSMGFLFVLFSPSLHPHPCLSLVFHLLCTFLSLHFYCALTGVQEELCEKKSKVDEDASGLVPYGGDSSDEEEERTRSSKTDNS